MNYTGGYYANTMSAKKQKHESTVVKALKAHFYLKEYKMIVYIANDSYQRDESGAILSMRAALEGRNQDTGESINAYVRLAREDLGDGATFEELTYTAKLEACKKMMASWLQVPTVNESIASESTASESTANKQEVKE